MLKNIIKTTFRSFWKNKTVTSINVIGLGVGLATCILMMLYIWDEASYDKHHLNKEDLYRVAIQFNDMRGAPTPAPMAEAFREEFPDVVQSARIFPYPMLESMFLTYQDNGVENTYQEINGYYVDSTFFDVLTYEFVEGDPHRALNRPNTMVLSASLATKIFGNKSPVGEILKVGLPEGDFDYRVDGVFEDSGLRSHVDARFFLSMANTDIGEYVAQETSWSSNNMFYTYLKAQPGTDQMMLEEKLREYYKRQIQADADARGMTMSIFLQPVSDIYLTSDLGFEIGNNGNIMYLYVFGSIGLFILLIACINFMNLSTAKSEKRAKEVGVRKVIGAEKVQLVRQFLGESLLMSFVSLALAIVILLVLLPVFNDFAGKSLQVFQDPWVLLTISILTVATGLIAGLYPAFYLSGFKTVAIIKGGRGGGYSAANIRKGLVVFQFVISVALIAMVLVIRSQMNFLESTPLGFDKEQQLVLSLQSSESIENFSTLKNSLENHQGVKLVSGGSVYPGLEVLQDWLLYAEGTNSDEMRQVHIGRVANDYIETLGLELIAGRSYTDDFTNEELAIILNEKAVKSLGFAGPEEALGKRLIMEWQDTRSEYEVVGVMKDYHFESLHKGIKPFGLVRTSKPPYLIAKIQTNQVKDVLDFAESSWKNINAATPFAYSFVDLDFQRNYEKEQRTATIILYFTSIAIIISCIGLFGLAAFTAEQRTKEIGIRKVLGASTWSITALVSREFLVLVGFAIVIAAPLSYYAASRWLENFAYKIELSIWVFLISGLLAVLIAYGTISFQALKAALANPVNSLKSE
ncbi:ABC transporter permease [Litoribacter ruber]|uniref:ABC transporter permease n=1 Tax=Litoribacter ruber TaxID=702568 RepID=UPI001BDA1E2A|nr:ABC transporter permease [Litoribacter ruber]MBT0811284.1 ABC transporter permease [Litoribacter ruber]